MSKGQFCENCIHRIICDHENKYRKVCSQFLEQRPHGEWIKQFDVKTQYYTCTCSVCGDTHRLLINYFLESNFCPNCGANMREGEEE